MSKVRRLAYRFIVSGLVVMSAPACPSDPDDPVPGGQPCDEADRCEADWRCYHGVCRRECDDHRDCAKTEACQSGACVPLADYACDEDADCSAPGECEAIAGAECYAGRCYYQRLDPGSACDDGNRCTSNDQCDSTGVCSGEEMVCDTPPADICSEDSVFREYVGVGVCDPSLGSCVYEFEETDCADCRHRCLRVPYAPGNLVASAGDAQVTLTWNGMAGAQSYNVYVSQTSGDTRTAEPVSVVSSAYTQTGLGNGTPYYFAVSAVIDAVEGDLSAEVSATPRVAACDEDADCNAPAECEAIAGAECYAGRCYYQRLDPGSACDDGNRCTSNDQCDSAGVCSGEEMVCDAPPADLCSEDSVFREYVGVGVCDPSLGSCVYEFEETDCADCRHRCLRVPYAPGNLVASAGDAQVTLTWNGMAGAQSYNVYVSQTSGDPRTAEPVSVASSAYTQTGLSNGTPYYFAVSAVIDAVEGDLSAEVSATPRIAAPVQVSARAGDRIVTLEWEPVDGADTYNVYWDDEPGVSFGADVRSGVTSPFEHEMLENGKTYYYAVTASDALSESELSAEVSATPRIAAPVQVSAYAGDRQVTLEWDPIDGADTYRVYWALEPGVAADNSNRAIVETSSFKHEALENGTVYYYALAAVSGPSESELSAEVSATPRISTPAQLSALGGDRLVTLEWDAVDGTDSYNVYWDDEPGVTILSATRVNVPSPSFVHEDLDNATTRYYAVTAVDGPSESELSEEVAGSTIIDILSDTRLLATDPQAGDLYGWSVALDGQFAISGARHEDGGEGDPFDMAGAAYVYHHDGSSWDSGTKLMAEHPRIGDYFGYSVGLSGDYAIAGAYSVDVELDLDGDGITDQTLPSAGAAFVFHYDGSGWDSGTRLVAPDPEAGAYLGRSVAISGDLAIAGAPREDGGVSLPDAGAAYVYRRTDADGWDSGTRLVADDVQAQDFFGVTVAASGDDVIVGARRAQDAVSYLGAAYVFHFDGSSWDSGTKLEAPGLQADALLGVSVAITDEYAMVGARRHDACDTDPSSCAGLAYVYRRTGPNEWDTRTTLVAPEAHAGDVFGWSVALGSDYAVVGAYQEDGGAGAFVDAGAAYVFRRTGPSQWDTGTRVVAGNVQPYSHFGYSVAVSGGRALVGAPLEDVGAVDPSLDAGAAYVYEF